MEEEFRLNHVDTKLSGMTPDEFVTFIENCEKEADRLEITVDYYIAEFT